MRPLTLLLVAGSGAVASIADAPGFAPAASALMADSASICWQRFSRGVSVETSCTTLGVSPRVDTVRIQLPSPPFVSFAFGPFDLYRNGYNGQGFTAGYSYTNPKYLISLLAKLRLNQQRAFLGLTEEPKDQYMTNGRFDLSKWEAGLAQYDTPALRAALESGVADGTILGYNMMDEPPHPGWHGSLTKATVDSMAAYCKSLFPFLACGVGADYRWRPAERYNLVDFVIAQTWRETQSPSAFRDSAVAMAKRNGVALVLSLNLFGAIQTPGCEPKQSECLLRPAEIREWGRTLLGEPYACAVTMWHYEPKMWARAEYQAQFQDLASLARQRIARSCRRPS
jgi:hypothetical protein